MLTLQQHIMNFSAVIFLILMTFQVTGAKAVCSRIRATNRGGNGLSFFIGASKPLITLNHVNFIFKGGVVSHTNCF